MHLMAMPARADELIATRATLLERLRSWQDQASWQQFFDTYWKLIYGVARKAGLTQAEAQDVVQETMLAAAKHLPGFRYDPAIGSFKTWLLNMTRWRITDQFRNRGPVSLRSSDGGPLNGRTETDFMNRIPDPAADTVEAVWEAEWQANLLEAAIAHVRRRIDPEKYQLFDLYVNRNWPPEKVAHTLGVSVNQVYLAKHRITELIRDEVHRLEKEVT